MTVRDGVEDQLSLAMHDLYSQMGLVYESANLQDMRSLAARLRASLDKLRSGSAPFAGVAANLEKTLTDASNGCRELEAREAEFEKKDGYVRFFGDGRLIKRDGTEIEAHAVQRQFVTFVTARSALDVLEAYFAVGPGDRTNTFVDNHWEPAGAVNVKTQVLPFSEKWKMTKRGYLTPGLDGPEAVIHYGSYDARDNFPAFAFSVLTLSAGYQSLLAKGSGSDRGEFGRGPGRTFR